MDSTGPSYFPEPHHPNEQRLSFRSHRTASAYSVAQHAGPRVASSSLVFPIFGCRRFCSAAKSLTATSAIAHEPEVILR